MASVFTLQKFSLQKQTKSDAKKVQVFDNVTCTISFRLSYKVFIKVIVLSLFVDSLKVSTDNFISGSEHSLLLLHFDI